MDRVIGVALAALWIAAAGAVAGRLMAGAGASWLEVAGAVAVVVVAAGALEWWCRRG